MRTARKIFVQLSFIDSQLEYRVDRKDSQSVLTFVRKVSSVYFGGDIQARQLERSSGGLRGYKIIHTYIHIHTSVPVPPCFEEILHNIWQHPPCHSQRNSFVIVNWDCLVYNEVWLASLVCMRLSKLSDLRWNSSSLSKLPRLLHLFPCSDDSERVTISSLSAWSPCTKIWSTTTQGKGPPFKWSILVLPLPPDSIETRVPILILFWTQ